MTMFPDKTLEECKRIDGAYYAAFPGIKEYHQYCYARAMEFAYTSNIFGVRYYGASGHKLINLLIQGSAAILLKLKTRELYDYIKANNLPLKFLMPIHDEVQFLWHKDTPPEVLFQLKAIMENWEDTLIPIVAEGAITTTTWADKKEVKDLNELRLYLSP